MTTFGAVMLCRRILDLQNKRGFNSYDVCRHEKKRKEKKASIVQLTLHRLSTTLSPLSRRDPAKTDKNNTRRLPAFAFHAKPGEKPSFNSYVCCRTKLQVTQKSSSDRRVSGVQLHLRMCNMALIFMIFFCHGHVAQTFASNNTILFCAEMKRRELNFIRQYTFAHRWLHFEILDLQHSFNSYHFLSESKPLPPTTLASFTQRFCKKKKSRRERRVLNFTLSFAQGPQRQNTGPIVWL